MQTLFDSSGLEEESLCPQRLRRRRKEKRSRGGKEGGDRRFVSGLGYQGDLWGVGRIAKAMKRVLTARKKGEFWVLPLQYYMRATSKSSGSAGRMWSIYLKSSLFNVYLCIFS